MTTVVTDVVDPGPPQVADGIAPGYGPGVPASGATNELKTLKQKIVTLTYSATYATGGIALTPDQMGGLKAIFARGSAGGGYVTVPSYNAATGVCTVKLFWRAADNGVLAEVPNGTAVATVKRLFVIGREA